MERERLDPLNDYLFMKYMGEEGSIITLQQIGYSSEKIATTLNMTIEEVNKILEEEIMMYER
jgi:hypothetical protein